MLFNSFEFIFMFLPIVFLGYFLLNKFQLILSSKIWLLISSLFFYSWWNIVYLPIMLTSLIINSIITKLMVKELNKAKSKVILLFGILFNVGLLGYFKYMDFFIENLNILAGWDFNTLNIILPLGISFFTFQIIAYIVDVYEGKVNNTSFLDFALFISFFPQLIAGPISLHKEIIPQFEEAQNRIINLKNISSGFFIFTIGLFKKVVIADTFAEWANLGYSNINNLSMFETWLTSISYTFQLYFDFSGYSDMAIGLGLLFNIKLPINFNSPYKALNIQDFWRRWHITLSSFLNSYLYVPLGGSRRTPYITYFNIMIVFLVSGFWHGAGWTFIVWGAVHGIAICIHKFWKIKQMKMPRFLAWIITFNFVNLAWVIFRSKSLGDAILVMSKMFIIDPKNLLDISTFGNVLNKYNAIFQSTEEQLVQMQPDGLILTFSIILCIAIFVSTRCKNAYEIIHIYSPNIKTAFIIAVLFSVSIFNMQRVTEFLYFNF